MKGSPRVSLIIVNYNGRDLLRDCLRSVSLSFRKVQFEIIVVDNGSTDGSLEGLEKSYPAVRILRLGENLGFGAANNRGAELAGGSYLLFLNNDTLIDPGAIEGLIEFADSGAGKDIGAIGLLLRDGSGKHCHSFGQFPKPFGQFGIWMDRLLGRSAYELRLRKEAERSDLGFFPVDFITGAALLVPHEVFTSIGGFDEGFFMYFEDAELQLRMARVGLKRLILNRGGIVHLQGGGKLRLNRTRIQTYRSMHRYYRRSMNPPSFILYEALFFVICVIQILNFHFSLSENLEFINQCVPARKRGNE